MAKDVKETDFKNLVDHKVRVIGADYSGVSRRSFVMGGLAATAALLSSAGFGAYALTTYDRSKNYIGSRINSLYDFDAAYPVRKSHENKELLTLYEEFLSPGGFRPALTEMSHRMCHTVYGQDVPERIKHLQEVSLDEVKEESKKQMEEYLAGQAQKEA